MHGEDQTVMPLLQRTTKKMFIVCNNRPVICAFLKLLEYIMIVLTKSKTSRISSELLNRIKSDLPARSKMTWSSRGSSEKWGILLAHSTSVKSCLSAAWQMLVTGSLGWNKQIYSISGSDFIAALMHYYVPVNNIKTNLTSNSNCITQSSRNTNV